jgi:hypothetical protein
LAESGTFQPANRPIELDQAGNRPE